MDSKVGRFGFLVHYVENWNWLFNFRPDLQMEEAQRRRALWPICSLMSLWYLAGRKSFNLLDSFYFNGLAGATVIIRNTGWQFFVKANRERIKQRILQSSWPCRRIAMSSARAP